MALRIVSSFCMHTVITRFDFLPATDHAQLHQLVDTLHDDLAAGNWIMDPIFSKTQNISAYK